MAWNQGIKIGFTIPALCPVNLQGCKALPFEACPAPMLLSLGLHAKTQAFNEGVVFLKLCFSMHTYFKSSVMYFYSVCFMLGWVSFSLMLDFN